MTHIPFLAPQFPSPSAIAEDYSAILARGTFSNGGPVEIRFASALEDWFGTAVKVALVASGTLGIQLAMAATFLAKKALVLVPSFTFAAGPLSVRLGGYEPVFLDIDGKSWQPALGPAADFLRLRFEETAGVLLTSTFGVANAEISHWEDLAADFGLPLVIDSAAGLGSEYPNGERLGSRGTCEVFSLHATKTLAVGEGGVVASRDPEVIRRINQLKNFGFDASRSATMLGTNAKLPELTSAIGLRQLEILPERLATRRQIFSWYEDGLRAGGIDLQPLAESSALPFVSALLPSPRARDAVLQAVARADIECRTYYNPPVHRHPVFKGGLIAGEMSATDEVAARIVSLPMSDRLAREDVARVASVVAEALHAAL